MIQDAKIFLERWTQLSGTLNADADLGSAELIDDKPAMGWCMVAATTNSAIRPGGIRENTQLADSRRPPRGRVRLARARRTKDTERKATVAGEGIKGR